MDKWTGRPGRVCVNGMAEKRTLTSRHLRLSNLSEILDSANLRGSGYKPVVPSTVCRVHCPCGRGGRGAGTNSQGAQQTGSWRPQGQSQLWPGLSGTSPPTESEHCKLRGCLHSSFVQWGFLLGSLCTYILVTEDIERRTAGP